MRDLGSPVKFFGPSGASVHDEDVTDFRPIVEKVGTVNPDGSAAHSGADKKFLEAVENAEPVPANPDAAIYADLAEQAVPTTATPKAGTIGSPAKD